jgi:hypothetical protein
MIFVELSEGEVHADVNVCIAPAQTVQDHRRVSLILMGIMILMYKKRPHQIVIRKKTASA